MRREILLLLIIASVFCNQADERISCERTNTISWDCCITASPLKTCFMDATTEITSPMSNITSRRDYAVVGLWLQSNKNIRSLPHNTARIFPNLLGLTAAECSIKTIAYENFKKLYKLRFLLLGYNEIEEIESETFEDLRSLQLLNLGKHVIAIHAVKTVSDGTLSQFRRQQNLFCGCWNFHESQAA